MRRVTLADMDRARRTRYSSALLYLTDRCPVGCAHCSVDSRPDGPRIADLELFGEVLAGICAVPSFRLVGVSGGEPFVERRALELAARRITEAGKDLVVYTSGVWATGGAPSSWIRAVLARSACVVLSTDAYHAERLPAGRFVAAARAIAAEGTWIAVQVVEGGRAAAEKLLAAALGPSWERRAELRTVPMLPYGRAAALPGHRPAAARRPGRDFGRCALADAPVVRYDGRILGCCNEAVVTGGGPPALRRTVRTRQETAAAVAELAADPYLSLIGRAGAGALSRLPPYAGLAGEEFAHICELCWRMLDRDARARPRDRRAGRLLLSVLAGED